jgi:hypothetical protein
MSDEKPKRCRNCGLEEHEWISCFAAGEIAERAGAAHRAELARLRAEVERLTRDHERGVDIAHMNSEKLARAAAIIAAADMLRNAADEIEEHADRCYVMLRSRPCSCGLAETLAAVKAYDDARKGGPCSA